MASIKGYEGYEIHNGIGRTKDIGKQTELKILFNIYLELKDINEKMNGYD